ncbi:MAG TPA: bifunctional oligoribonuclease/PAP phosphatase NrnA [Pseudogracilibacillus sp.]|nr:bifunctional oligoribonuclease/PAP phosphatase NrnA [Pseudogracilibacillus sp.]
MVKKQIIDEIVANDTIIIHRHVRPDPDALGSQCGLKAMILASFPKKQVYVVGEDEPSLAFMATMDEISDDLYEDALVIVCDTANTERIDDDRYRLGKKLIKIDHHPNNEPYGDLVWVDTHASSTSEMIYELYEAGKIEHFEINDAFAKLIYGGIVGDTGRFLFPSTTNKTFQYAAQLINYDFDRQALYDGMYKIDEKIARLRGYVLQNFELTENGSSAIYMTKDVIEKYKVSTNDTGKLVGALGDIDSVKAWVFFIEEDDLIRVRLRSKGPVINALAAKYNGGGHPMASGATVYSWDEAKALTKELDELCKQYKK